MKTRNTKGFTLVEIMIVVVIIGLLAAMAIPAFAKVRANSRAKAIDNNVRQISGAIDQFVLENGASTCGLTDLVGTDKYIKSTIATAAGETYWTSFTAGASRSLSWNGSSGTVSKSWDL